MGEKTHYKGSCHCGAVSYEVDADLDKVLSCNCSMCARKGTLLKFVPASDFKLLTGEKSLTDYQFNKHTIHHLFCSTCGVTSFARGKGRDGSEQIAINTRCLEGVDPTKIETMHWDGKSA